jgi:glycerol-3-phosphate acyltransferase PlsY
MLTSLIVTLYVWLLEIALWLTLSLAGVWGYHVMVPIMREAGAILTNEFAWQICGALAFAIIAFLALAVIFGPILILVDVRNTVRNIEAKLERGTDVSNSLPLERREPSF